MRESIICPPTPISALGLDKLNVNRLSFQNVMAVMKVTTSSLISLDLNLVRLVVEHNILSNWGHKICSNNSCALSYIPPGNIKYNVLII